MSATSTSREEAELDSEFITTDQWDASRALAHQFEQAFQPLG